MKKLLILMLTITTSCLLTMSCKKNTSANEITKPHKNLDLVSLIPTLGTLHNEGLHMLDTTGVFSNISPGALIITSSGYAKLGGYYKNLAGFDSSWIDSVPNVDSMANWCNNGVFTNLTSIDTKWESTVLKLTSLSLNPYELQYVDSVYSIMNQNFTGMSNTAIANKIMADINTLITYYNADVSAGHLNGELAGSLIYIAKGSASYWSTNYIGLPPGSPPMIWTWGADPGAYLFTWGAAWIADQGPGYSNSWDAQMKRISIGLAGAVYASGGGWLPW